MIPTPQFKLLYTMTFSSTIMVALVTVAAPQIDESTGTVSGLQKAVPYIGVQLSQVEQGVQIPTVHPKTPADLAGLKNGDIINAINGEVVDTLDSIIALIRSHRYGEVAVVSLLREGKPLNGVVLVRAHDVTYDEERAHPNAAPLFGAVKGSLTVPSWPVDPKGKPCLIIGWDHEEGENQALEWLEGLVQLAEKKQVAVVGWNGLNKWTDKGRERTKKLTPSVQFSNTSWETWKKEQFMASGSVWCLVTDGQGRIKGYLTYPYREWLGEMGKIWFHMENWAGQIQRSWFAKYGLTMEDKAEGVGIKEVAPPSSAVFQPGDVIIKIEGVRTKTTLELTRELKSYTSGNTVTAEVIRGGQTQWFTWILP